MARAKNKAKIVVKRQYTGDRDMEKVFTEIIAKALIKSCENVEPNESKDVA